jgi:dimethylhistidine N-methyltransferase
MHQQLTDKDVLAEFIDDVREGLLGDGQKTLPSKYLYDDVGSALFDAICGLPEYGLTRADERILRRNAGSIVEKMPPTLTVTELGSGSGRKTRHVLDAVAQREETTYFPIDISRAALTQNVGELAGIDGVTLEPLEDDYLSGLEEVDSRRDDGNPMLVLFLGSTIGNFDRPVGLSFLREIRTRLQPGDALLLGTDLVKPVEKLIPAYNDALGITAAFNRNLLQRLNRELGGEFDLGQFAHEVRYDEGERRIEMHLRSRMDQEVRIEAGNLEVPFKEKETIWTESSHKFTRGEPIRMGEKTGYRCEGQWFDDKWPFAESLLIAE